MTEERRIVGSVHVDPNAPGVIVRGKALLFYSVDDDLDNPAARPGPEWRAVGYTTDGPGVFGNPEAETLASAGTHDGPMTFDVQQGSVGPGMFEILFGKRSERPTYDLRVTAQHCPVAKPVKGRGLTGKRYRIARRRYAREMRAWRRLGSPMAATIHHLPRAHVHATSDGGYQFAARPTER